MNTFTVSIKQDGAYTPISGTPVFPFSMGELLDERLDEAYITVYGCAEEFFKPLTEVMVTVNDGTSHDYYFIVANDQSVELPVGSGKYKHQLYLIERTKLLEGVVCPTLTFTNSLGNTYTNNPIPVIAQVDQSGVYSDLHAAIGDEIYTYSQISSPLAEGVPYTVPSPESIATDIATKMTDYLHEMGGSLYVQYEAWPNAYINGVSYFSKVTVNTRGSSIEGAYQEELEITPRSELTLEYVIIVTQTGAGTSPDNRTLFKITFQLVVVKNQYPLKPWSITDCFNRVLECAEPLLGDENPKYVFDGVTYVDGEIQPYDAGSLAEKYDKIEAPEFTLTQDTLREQLKVICSKIHAEPWLDENNVIQLTEYGQQKRSNLSAPYVYKSPSYSINQYCTEVRSNAQNLVSSLDYARGVMIDPANDLYRSLRTEMIYARINAENGIAETNQRIYSIQKVMCGVINGEVDASTGKYTGPITGWRLEPVDITPYVYEATEYGANLNAQSGAYPYSKSYAIYYTQGEKGLRGIFYRPQAAPSTAVFGKYAITNILISASDEGVSGSDLRQYIDRNPELLAFQITYKPISNHFISHGKQLYISGETPYAQMYNQSENLTESDYFGENIKGVAARLGNVEEERTYYLPSVSHIPKVGEILDGYAISATSTEVMPSYIKCTLGLTKDFNRISQYVGINSMKRMYEVSERQAYQRDILVKATLLLSGTLPDEDYSNFLFEDYWQEPYYKMLNGRDHSSKISSALLSRYSKNRDPLTGNVRIILPVISRALGNAITFSFAPKDNYSAGQWSDYTDENEIVGWWANDARYTDYYGRVYWSSVVLYAGDLTYSSDVNTATTATTLPKIPDEIFPQNEFAARYLYHRLRKDNREIPSYNIELEAKTDQSDISIGSAFASLSPFVTDENEGEPELIYFKKSTVNITKFDQIFTATADGENVILASYASADLFQAYERTIYNSLEIDINILPAYRNSDYGWLVRTPISSVEETVEDEDGNVTTYERRVGGKILLFSDNASIVNTGDGWRNLYLYITK